MYSQGGVAGELGGDVGVKRYARAILPISMRLRRVDRSLMVWRKRMQLGSLLLALCLAALVNIVGGSEFLSVAK